MQPDKEGKNIFLCARDGMKKIEIEGSKISPIEFEAFFDYRPYGEREYIFDHIWQQVNDKFYVADLQGTDWNGYKETYKRFLPYINNNYDFVEMLSEMLGELNGSHTGARYYASGAALPTAALGVFYDEAYAGDGLKIKEIIAQSPLTKKKTDVKPGCIIEKVDGVAIKAGADYFPLLEGKAGRKVILSVYNPVTGKRFEETLKPYLTVPRMSCCISAGWKTVARRWMNIPVGALLIFTSKVWIVRASVRFTPIC